MNDESVIPVMVNGAGIRDTRGREYADYYYDPGQISGIWPSCDVPTNIRFFLLSNTAPAYSHGQQFSVGLGHGWDSIVSVNGVDKGDTTMRWYRTGTQNLTIGTRLYGESSKIQPGVLSGSATLLMILP